jgi:hypothetical protein
VDRKKNRLQLLSFKSADRTGPAISRIIQLPVHLLRQDRDGPLMFSKEVIMQSSTPSVENVPMRYREARYSRGMFLGALVGMLPNLLPQIAPVIGNLLGGLTGGGNQSGGSASGGASAITNLLSNQDFMRQISSLISQIAGGGGSPPSTSSTQSLGAPSRRRTAYAKTQSGANGNRVYAEAQWAQLLAMLPQLMPLLQQVLRPETIQAVVSQPNQHLNTVINGLKDFARIGIESHEQDLRHLRELNPGVNDPALDQLLAGMSVGLSQPMREISFKRVTSVQIDFADIVAQELFGKTKVLYLAGGPLAFPLDVQTPRTINRAIVQVVIKDPETLAIRHSKKMRLTTVETGRLPVVPRFEAEDVRDLEAGRDYLLTVALVWQNRAGKKRGTSRQQKFSLVGPYSFDRVEESSQLIPLNDGDRYRHYWHKIWQGSFSEETKRFEFQCKYYTVLRTNNTSNARTETKMKIVSAENRKKVGKLKAGMEYSLDELNRLLQLIDSSRPLLTEQELAALRSDDFAERFNQAGRYRAGLRGRAGDAGVMWVYPEVKLQGVVLQKASELNENGLVRRVTEHRVTFPLPALVHFIGARTI